MIVKDGAHLLLIMAQLLEETLLESLRSLHLRIVVLKEHKEVREIVLAVQSHFGSIKNHNDEYEFGELNLLPVLLFVEVLKHSRDHDLQLFAGVHDG